MQLNFTKGWYLCCYKYWLKNLNVHSNIYSRESSLIFRGKSTVQFNKYKNEQTKQDRCLDETNKKSNKRK